MLGGRVAARLGITTLTPISRRVTLSRRLAAALLVLLCWPLAQAHSFEPSRSVAGVAEEINRSYQSGARSVFSPAS